MVAHCEKKWLLVFMHPDHLVLGFQCDHAVIIGVIGNIIAFNGRSFDGCRHLIIIVSFHPFLLYQEHGLVFRLLVLTIGWFAQTIGIIARRWLHVRHVPRHRVDPFNGTARMKNLTSSNGIISL